MENKLQQLTQKLYEEGLSKGRDEADKILTDAQAEAQRIVAKSKADAQHIMDEAARKAEDMGKNTRTEVALAARQTLAALKDSITEMIVTKSLGSSVKDLALNPSFVKDMLLTVAGNWQGINGGNTELTALLPIEFQAHFESALKDSMGAVLNAGVEVQFSGKVKNGFKIGPKNGGYHISLTEEDFKAFLSDYIRPKVANIIYEDR